MPRLGLRSAGRAVEESAQALADDLLLVEQGASAAITDHFVRFAPEALACLRRGDLPLVHLDDAIHESTLTARDSMSVAATMAVASTRTELVAVGDALSAHIAAQAGCAAAAAQAQARVDDGMAAFNFSVPGVRQQFVAFLRTQKMRAKDPEGFHARAFAQRAVAGMGVGAWFRPPVWLLSQVRASTYAVVNHVKMHGIDGMNRALEAG